MSAIDSRKFGSKKMLIITTAVWEAPHISGVLGSKEGTKFTGTLKYNDHYEPYLCIEPVKKSIDAKPRKA